jgi:hypothetical protein
MVSVLGLHLSGHKRDRSCGDRLQINGDTTSLGAQAKGVLHAVSVGRRDNAR